MRWGAPSLVRLQSFIMIINAGRGAAGGLSRMLRTSTSQCARSDCALTTYATLRESYETIEIVRSPDTTRSESPMSRLMASPLGVTLFRRPLA